VIRDADKTLDEAVRDVVHHEPGFSGLWVLHSAAPAPSWVESDNPDLEQALADHYGCPIGRPQESDE
jgi:hypothetical protein